MPIPNEQEPTPTLQTAQPEPTGGLSHKSKVRLGLAVILTVIALAGTLGRPKRLPVASSVTASPLVAPNANVVTRERERIDRNTRLADTVDTAPAPARDVIPARQQEENAYAMGGGIDTVAQARAEKQKRDADSLFSDTVVDLSGKRPARARSSAPATPLDDEGTTYQLPTTEELTKSIVNELAASRPTPPAAQAVAVTPAPASATAPIHNETPSQGMHRLYEGHVIDATLLNRLSGDMDGPVNAQVSNAVYASDGTLVIPAGAHVLGKSRQVQTFGVTRVATTFHRVLMLQPDGVTTRSVSLDQFQGMNQIGDVGLRDQVNRHYLSTFGASAAVGLITGVAQTIGGRFGTGGDNNTVVIAGGITDASSQAVAQTMSQFLNRPWTVTIREGKRVKVYITSDVDLPAYGGGR